jgi:hypothetical protein
MMTMAGKRGGEATVRQRRGDGEATARRRRGNGKATARQRRGKEEASTRQGRGKKDAMAIGYGAAGGRGNEAINKRITNNR